MVPLVRGRSRGAGSSRARPLDDREADGQAPDEDESLAEAALIDPRSGPEAEERAYEEAVIEGETDLATRRSSPRPRRMSAESQAAAADWNAPPDAEAEPDTFSPFAGEDEEEPQRSGALTKVLIVALVMVACRGRLLVPGAGRHEGAARPRIGRREPAPGLEPAARRAAPARERQRAADGFRASDQSDQPGAGGPAAQREADQPGGQARL